MTKGLAAMLVQADSRVARASRTDRNATAVIATGEQSCQRLRTSHAGTLLGCNFGENPGCRPVRYRGPPVTGTDVRIRRTVRINWFRSSGIVTNSSQPALMLKWRSAGRLHAIAAMIEPQ